MHYREPQPSDYPAIARLRVDWGDDAARLGERLARYAAGEHHPREALPARMVVVAEEDGAPVGYVAAHLTRRFACAGELEQIWVAPAFRGRGVAAELLRRAARWLADRGARRVCVDVQPDNLRARRFYARHGARPLKPTGWCGTTSRARRAPLPNREAHMNESAAAVRFGADGKPALVAG